MPIEVENDLQFNLNEDDELLGFYDILNDILMIDEEYDEMEGENTPSESTNTFESPNEFVPDIIYEQFMNILTFTAKHNLSRECCNDLLKLLKDILPETQKKLPSDIRTLRPKKILYDLEEIEGGEMAYFGIERHLRLPVTGPMLYDPDCSTLLLSIDMDGAPITTKGTTTIWPIMGTFFDEEKAPVFVINLYCGKEKPTDFNKYMASMVDEISRLTIHGLHLNGKKYDFRLRELLGDSPAKADALGCKHPNGYCSCPRCCTMGEYFEHRTTYPDQSQPERTHEEFLRYAEYYEARHSAISENEIATSNEEDSDFDEDDLFTLPEQLPQYISQFFNNNPPTILRLIPHFDLVKQVYFDYMHLVCLGVMKKLIEFWLSRNSKIQIHGDKLKQAEELLSLIRKEFCIREFSRRVENLQFIKHWKATQLRSFLLYFSCVVLYDAFEIPTVRGVPTNHLLPEVYYRHFLKLVEAIRIFSRVKNVTPEQLTRGRDLINSFVKDCEELYGKEFVILNVHCLIHLYDDRVQRGPLDKFSVFRFENFIGFLKRISKPCRYPLKQIANAYSLLLHTQAFLKNDFGTEMCSDKVDGIQLSLPVPRRTMQNTHISLNFNECHGKTFQLYRRAKFPKFCIRSDRSQDSYIFFSDLRFMRVTQILQCTETKEMFTVGHYYEEINDFFPRSRDTGIVLAGKSSNQPYMRSMKDISEKCCAMPAPATLSESGNLVLIRLLH